MKQPSPLQVRHCHLVCKHNKWSITRKLSVPKENLSCTRKVRIWWNVPPARQCSGFGRAKHSHLPCCYLASHQHSFYLTLTILLSYSSQTLSQSPAWSVTPKLQAHPSASPLCTRYTAMAQRDISLGEEGCKSQGCCHRPEAHPLTLQREEPFTFNVRPQFPSTNRDQS